MLPTFVIGLREGLEAALIVGIVAAFLKRNGRGSDMWALWTGVGLGVTLCVAGGIVLRIAERNLPQRQQEGLETIVGLVAVAFVSWMVLWMRAHARELKGELEANAAAALATGSAWALVLMAFLAVLREGFETAVFLLAILQSSTNATASMIGAMLGIAVAVVIGWGIYRGGVKINMARFFRLTGIVLVLVAAGLLATAAHTAHEAGWLNSLQGQALDLQWLVNPGSVRAALITGMFGVQPQPTGAEVIAWLVYAVPFLVIVVVPPRSARRKSPVPPATVTVGS
ncbi:MAG TPA: iron uptake transporter permease EfeU [Acidimicrobiia bacterium]|nr:iron uptake transporter permease EfeU [Acidimicrobiia bacterium]